MSPIRSQKSSLKRLNSRVIDFRWMKEPRNYAKAGYSMILVSGSLAAIGIMALFMADDVLLSDNISRDNAKHFEECKMNDFVDEKCVQYRDRINNKISGIHVDPEKWK